MYCVEIVAKVKGRRWTPSYPLGITTEQEVFGCVLGDCPVEEQLKQLEKFRRATMELLKECVEAWNPPDPRSGDTPFIALELVAGEDALKPVWRVHCVLSRDRRSEPFWQLSWKVGDGDYRDVYRDTVESALSLAKGIIDRETGAWAAEVEFEGPVARKDPNI